MIEELDGFHFYTCDLCDTRIIRFYPDGLPWPDGALWVGEEIDHYNTRHVCPSCRYAGAVDLVNVLRVSTVTQQLRQTGSTASKILMHKDIPPQAKHAARMVIIDLQLCVEKLKKVSVAIESLGY